MNAVRLREKAQQDNHPFELSEVENLPEAIQNPIAVFESSTIFGRRVIFTELQHKEKNFVAVLELERDRGSISINSVRSVYPRNNTQIISAISKGETLYINKEKAIDWLSKQQFNSADVTQLIDSTTKIIQNFENPKINAEKEENQEQSIDKVEISKPLKYKIGDVVNMKGWIENEQRVIVGVIKGEKARFENDYYVMDKNGNLKSLMENSIKDMGDEFSFEQEGAENIDKSYKELQDKTRLYIERCGSEGGRNIEVELIDYNLLKEKIENSLQKGMKI